MKNKNNTTFKRIIYSITGIVLIMLFIGIIQPELIFAQKNKAVINVAISPDTAQAKNRKSF